MTSDHHGFSLQPDRQGCNAGDDTITLKSFSGTGNKFYGGKGEDDHHHQLQPLQFCFR